MNQDEMKRQAAEAALEYVVTDSIVGVGTGSTVNHFIDLLSGIKGKIEGAVSSSEASTERMKQHGIQVYDLNAVNELPVYIDGARRSSRAPPRSSSASPTKASWSTCSARSRCRSR